MPAGQSGWSGPCCPSLLPWSWPSPPSAQLAQTHLSALRSGPRQFSSVLASVMALACRTALWGCLAVRPSLCTARVGAGAGPCQSRPLWCPTWDQAHSRYSINTHQLSNCIYPFAHLSILPSDHDPILQELTNMECLPRLGTVLAAGSGRQ